MGDFKPHEGVEHAAELQERRGGAKWIPIAAAVVAVLAAMTNLVSTQRSTQALIAKNDAIVALTHASDTYNYYQAKSIKEELYRAQIVDHPGKAPPALQAVVDRQDREKAP